MKRLIYASVLCTLSAILISSLFIMPFASQEPSKSYNLRYNKFTGRYSIKVENLDDFKNFVSENDIDLYQSNGKLFYYDSYKLSKNNNRGMKIWVS